MEIEDDGEDRLIILSQIGECSALLGEENTQHTNASQLWFHSYV